MNSSVTATTPTANPAATAKAVAVPQAKAARGSPRACWTLPLGVANYATQYTQDTARILAFTALSMVPALASFVLAGRRILGGLMGAVKG
jgi:ABC-type glycerol-3-phosphate transport system permease component